ncbi:MAG: cobalamin biosynthesis protein CobD [Alphaproteobacteria bacterium]|nr:cobalamin biosynthesis protein CobD [Alphaproteobacteria bacterium]
MIPSPSLFFVITAIALLADALIGDPDRIYRLVPHPVVLMGRLIGFLDRVWNRSDQSPLRRIYFGALTAFIVVGVSGAIGMVLHVLLQQWAYGWIMEGLLMSVLIAQRSLYLHVAAVATAFSNDGLAGARQAVGKIVGRDTSALDEEGVAAGAIESLAENFSDGVVAPVFWGVVFGLPGVLAYKALNTADSMIGHRTEKHLHFGSVSARADDVANFIPARLSGLIIWAAILFKSKAWHAMMVDACKHRSVNAGYPEAAMAGALGIRLSGPRLYEGQEVDEPWVGGDFNEPTCADIDRALAVFLRACLILLGIIAVLAFVFMR